MSTSGVSVAAVMPKAGADVELREIALPKLEPDSYGPVSTAGFARRGSLPHYSRSCFCRRVGKNSRSDK